MHGANHGQFNEGWGRKDYGPPGHGFLNLAPIIDAEAQRGGSLRFRLPRSSSRRCTGLARSLSAFFRDPRVGDDWLPEGIYVHRYTDASFVPVAEIEEDIDVTSASLAGVRISASGSRAVA